MAKRKTTVYLDEDVLRAARVQAARSGRSDSQVFEDALRRFLGLDLIDPGEARQLDEDEALDLAYREIHRARW